MRSGIKFIIIIFSFTSIGLSQNLPEFAKELAPNYAVPDAPAFNMLNDNPDNILKPSSVKDMGIAFADFLGEDNRITLPQALALEFSPALLINGKNLSLEEYRKNDWLYRLRVSLATKRQDTNSSSDIALGIRFSTEDESDLRTNQEYINEATELSQNIQAKIDEVRLSLGPTATMEQIESDSAVVQTKRNLVDEFLNKWDVEKWNEDNWNADITEYAFAVKAGSQDSLVKNLKFNRVSVWYTKAKKLSSWGQYLLGIYGNYEKPPDRDKYESSGSLIARLYAGTNRYKIFMEGQGTLIDDQKPEWLFNSGLELKVDENLWIDLTAGIETNGQQESVLVTGFKFKFGLQ
jgi:predicted nucleotidyltransferase